jgi:hypothetical protein
LVPIHVPIAGVAHLITIGINLIGIIHQGAIIATIGFLIPIHIPVADVAHTIIIDIGLHGVCGLWTIIHGIRNCVVVSIDNGWRCGGRCCIKRKTTLPATTREQED